MDSSIQWRSWSYDAFRAAEREGKPVLLTLTATWCHWCHVMDQTSYSDPRVIGLVNSRFIPVRVDVDQRPDISRRYNQGGFPSVAFLDTTGRLIAGRVYTPPEQMVALLEQVSAGRPSVPPRVSQDAALPATPLPGGSQESPTGLALERLWELYDPDFGGFGREPKQPPWEGLRLLLARYSRSGDRSLLRMVTATLDHMRGGLYDQRDQGFFRYSVARDWKVPHYEKMLYTNASLASVYLEVYQVTRRKLYQDTAAGVLGYLLSTLYDQGRGLFYASQDAAEEYYRLPWKDRAAAPPATIDRTFYTGWNALAAASLIKGYGVLGLPAYLETASKTLEVLWNESWSPERGLAHVAGQWGPTGFLADHVHALQALLALYQATGNPELLDRAVAIAQSVPRLFGAPDGGFYDASETLATSDRRATGHRPVLENSLLAEGLLALSCLTGESQYQTMARKTLETFQGVAPGSSYLGPPGSYRMEQDEERLFLPAGSAWGWAWDALDSGPVHTVLVGRASEAGTLRLLAAALSTFAPHQVVQRLDPERDAERVSSLGFPPEREPALYVCMGGMCLAPIHSPAEMKKLQTVRPWASASPFAASNP